MKQEEEKETLRKKINYNKLACKLFGHDMHSPWRTSNYLTNVCLRCGYKNKRYKKEGYIRK